MRKREKIFVSAYACEPGYGSEIGVGWHWIIEMSKYFDLWVLTRESNRNTIEAYLSERQLQNEVTFVYYDLPEKLRFWKKGLRGVRIYYNLWQIFSNRLVEKVMKENDIKIYHLLTYGNSLWKASSYGMKKTFIWGPTGGTDTIPAEYSKHYGLKSRMMESTRRILVKTLKINIGFQKRCKNADLIFCKTENMYQSIPEKYRHKAIIFTDVAVNEKKNSIPVKKSSTIKFIAVGRLDGWRGFDILIEAFHRALYKNKKISLEILGDGIDKNRLERMIRKYHLEKHITLCGKVKRAVYEQKMGDADVVVNPNLKEGAVTVAFDCLAWCKPLICVETGGYTNCFSNEYARVIKMTDRQQLIEKMTDSIIELTDEKIRSDIKEKIFINRDKYTWEEKGKQIYWAIERAL